MAFQKTGMLHFSLGLMYAGDVIGGYFAGG